METWDAIRTRRNVREFDDRPIPPDDLDRIVAAAGLAPSSMNEQRWAFVVCRDKESLEELSHAGDYADHVAGAAAAIAFDLGQAVENAMLAAWELGIGSCHASVYDEPRVRELLAYPPEMTCDLVVSFGYPADPGSLGRPGFPGRSETPSRSPARRALLTLAPRPGATGGEAPREPNHARRAYVWVNREGCFR